MTPNEIETAIDKRIAETQAVSELKLYRQVDSTIKEKFEESRKLITWFLGALALMLTLFGIKTFSDLQDVAKSTASDQVKKYLSIDDPNSEFRRDVDRVVARSLIASYLPALIAKRDDDFGLADEITLSEQDVRRFSDYIGSEATGLKDFSDIVEII